MNVCTIIARNYLPAARVLAASMREHHPGLELDVLVIDGHGGPVDGEPFRVVQPAELEIADYEQMAAIYSVLELSTAVKPWLLRSLLRRPGADGAIYLDPDMRLYAPIGDVLEAVRSHDVVLNPHNVEPMPRDGKKPSEQDILISGAYNLGFLGLRRGEFADFLLDWWCERLRRDCIVEPERGFFVDQRWMDFVPGMATDLEVVRDEGFNVAYWNLPTRRLARAAGGYTVNGVPLRLFHFSGFKADRPHSLSTYQDRIRLGDDPILAELCETYARELIEAGYEQASEEPYGWRATAGGLELDELLRRLYRDALEDGVDGSLFDPEGERRFVEWLNEPDGPGARYGITRFLQRIWDRRFDLRAVYPDLSVPEDAEGFLGWSRVFGSHEVPIPGVLAVKGGDGPEAELMPDAPNPRAGTPAGVNVAGYFRAELGVGEVGRQVIAALDAHALPVLPVGLHAPLSRAGHAFAAQRRPRPAFDINVICVNADGLPRFAAEVGPEFFEGRHNVGLWWWELSTFPDEYHGAFEYVDEVWAGSRFVADALAGVSPVPVVYQPTPVAEPAPVAPDRERLGLPEGHLFLFAYDYNSVFERKNPLGVVEAFRRAFPEGDEPVVLALKSINHERDALNHDRVRLAARQDPRILVVDRYLTAADKDRLTASCDTYVSLHRSEGFGIGMAEALLRGKPVIATAYGGNTDFVTEATAYPVGYELREVGPDARPYPADALWAEPDVEAAALAMRRVVEAPEEAASRAAAGGDLLRERHSPRAAGAHMVRRLRGIEALREDEPVPESKATRPLPPPRVEDVLGQIRRGPEPTPGSSAKRLARPVRKALLRLLRPYTAYADAVDRDLAEAVGASDRNLRAAIARAEMDATVTQAEILAELRRLRARIDELEQGDGR